MLMVLKLNNVVMACAALHALYMRASAHDKTKIKVQTKAGIVEPELGQNGWVRVNMGYPKFLPQEIPFIADAPEALYDIALANNEQLTIDVVNIPLMQLLSFLT